MKRPPKKSNVGLTPLKGVLTKPFPKKALQQVYTQIGLK